MRAIYRHTNIISEDWNKLARFYETVFGCIRVPPERHLSGRWLDKGTGVVNAKLSGVQLRLPGHGDSGPTLEIFQYAENAERLPPAPNREGIGHLAFEVDDVAEAMAEVLANGGRKVGEITSFEVEGIGVISFVYIADPEGNMIELQAFD
jgi:catechol 2,3-dioxygenase-like lactoylglutathione lyase family enzyme